MDDRTEKLEEVLGPAEIAKRADELAHLMGVVGEKKEHRKRIAKELGTEIDELEARGRELAREIRARRTYVEVEVQDVRNEEERSIDTVRRDTGEVIRSRPMTAEERQANLFDLREQRGRKRSSAESDAEPEPAK